MLALWKLEKHPEWLYHHTKLVYTLYLTKYLRGRGFGSYLIDGSKVRWEAVAWHERIFQETSNMEETDNLVQSLERALSLAIWEAATIV